mmetsp:Transcript_34688/g.61000  ORF Transcript_34688/g.61000 Transcript_34688/m.61000 type:complete len:455 (-) Transcript_34688:188-1552(-)
MEVACIGAGYVGGPTMAVLAKQISSCKFTVLDLSAPRIQQWNSDDLPVFEPGLSEIVQECRGRNLFFSTDIQGALKTADIIFIAVNTPTKHHGIGAEIACDLTYFERAAVTIAETLQGRVTHVTIVEKSTVPVKTAEAVTRLIKALNPSLSFAVVSNPEFLAEGTAIKNLIDPDRVVLGGDPAAVDKVKELYLHWLANNKIVTTNCMSSELAKICCNAMLAQRISSINSISAVCEKTGADIRQVAQVIGTDTRIGSQFLNPSVGFGGSCFKKDILSLVYLAECLHLPEVAEYWRQVLVINEFQRRRFLHTIVSTMMTLREKKVALFGFAYKKNTADTRETVAAFIAHSLIQEGAEVRVYDPKVTRLSMLQEIEAGFGMRPEESLVTCSSCYEAAENCCAIVLLTEWEEFQTADYRRLKKLMASPSYIFDGRNILDREVLQSAGFVTYSMGQAFN